MNTLTIENSGGKRKTKNARKSKKSKNAYFLNVFYFFIDFRLFFYIGV